MLIPASLGRKRETHPRNFRNSRDLYLFLWSVIGLVRMGPCRASEPGHPKDAPCSKASDEDALIVARIALFNSKCESKEESTNGRTCG